MAYTVVDKGSKYFTAKTYTANASTQNITGLEFKPDFVWTKSRANAYNHNNYDVIRGATVNFGVNQTRAEGTDLNSLTSFNSDGFTLGYNEDSNYTNGSTAVSWNWLAGGTGVSNTAGTISSTVSANTTSGFSIVSYTGTGSVGTVGHGLGVAPKMIILKNRDRSIYWNVYHASLGKDYFFKLNTTDSAISSANIWGVTAPTSTVFDGAGNDSSNGYYSGDKIVAYCFAEVKGFSKAFSYTGNGSTNGTFVHLGFRPAFFMIKRTDSTGNWIIIDKARDTYNVAINALLPNSTSAEVTSYGSYDFVSNGVKIRTTDIGANASGGTYIGFAIAEQPFVSSKGIVANAR
jgi:hypothetical protein